MHGTDPGWHRIQVEHDRREGKKLAKGGGARFWDWEATMMFYEIVIALDGYAEARGIPTPKKPQGEARHCRAASSSPC